MIIIHATSVGLEIISMYYLFAINAIFIAAMSTATLSLTTRFLMATGFASTAGQTNITITNSRNSKVKNNLNQNNLQTNMWPIEHGQDKDRARRIKGIIYQSFEILGEPDDLITYHF